MTSGSDDRADAGMTQKHVYSMEEFCQAYGIGLTKAYEEIREGRLQVRKVGRRTLVPAAAAEAWLKALPTLADAAA